jgi:hypothetical protein
MRTDGLQRGASELKLRSTGWGGAFKCQAETVRHSRDEMAFSGISDAQKRADIIAYLSSLKLQN